MALPVKLALANNPVILMVIVRPEHVGALGPNLPIYHFTSHPIRIVINGAHCCFGLLSDRYLCVLDGPEGDKISRGKGKETNVESPTLVCCSVWRTNDDRVVCF